MYNLRYHIASLVGVFLALALGLILGGLAVGSGTVERQQSALVVGLRKEFSSLRSQNVHLESSNLMLEEFAKQANDQWVPDRLEGVHTLVVTNTGRTDGLQIASRDIEGAGGTVAVVTINTPALGLSDGAVRSKVESLTGPVTDVSRSVVASLAAEWQSSEGHPMTDLLVEAGVITVQGLDEGVVIDGVVDIAASGGDPDPVGVALAIEFASAGRVGIGAQTTNAGTGVAAAAADAGASGFDTLGTEVGRYTLVALLSRGAPGYYGFASGVDAAFPPIPKD